MSDDRRYSKFAFPDASDCPSFICDNVTQSIPSWMGQLYHDSLRVTAELVIIEEGKVGQVPNTNWGHRSCGWSFAYGWLKDQQSERRQERGRRGRRTARKRRVDRKVVIVRGPEESSWQHGHDQYLRNFLTFVDFFLEHEEFVILSDPLRTLRTNFGKRLNLLLHNLELVANSSSHLAFSSSNRIQEAVEERVREVGAACHAGNHPHIYRLLRLLLTAHLPSSSPHPYSSDFAQVPPPPPPPYFSGSPSLPPSLISLPQHISTSGPSHMRNKIIYFPRYHDRTIQNEKELLVRLRDALAVPLHDYPPLEVVVWGGESGGKEKKLRKEMEEERRKRVNKDDYKIREILKKRKKRTRRIREEEEEKQPEVRDQLPELRRGGSQLELDSLLSSEVVAVIGVHGLFLFCFFSFYTPSNGEGGEAGEEDEEKSGRRSGEWA